MELPEAVEAVTGVDASYLTVRFATVLLLVKSLPSLLCLHDMAE